MLFLLAWPWLPAQAFVYSITGHTNDYAIAEGNPPTAISPTGTSLRIGANDNTTPGGGRNAVMIFKLPALGANEIILSARVTCTVAGRAGSPTFNGDLWGIGFQTNTAPILAYFEGDLGDPQGVKLEDNLLLPPMTNGAMVSNTNSLGLGAYLQSFYATNADYAGGAFVFLRLTPDADAGTGSIGWSISSAEGANPPLLTITTSGVATQQNLANFLIIITDDQRWDALGVVQREMGAAARFPWFTNQSPNLDRLAAEGLRFRNAFVTCPLCSPSRAAILTGRYNHGNGIINNSTPFPTNAVSFATQLRAAGYMTGWAGKYHMDSQRERPGFDFAASYVAQGQYNDATFLVNGISTVTSGWVDDVATEYALNFLETNQGRSFALVVGFKSPHSPRTPPARHASLYTNETAAPVPSLDHLAPYRTNAASPAADDLRNYFRCLKGVDDNVGRLLDRLDLLGLTTNTLVIFCGDNGYYLGEHGLGDKRSMYDESIRIPLLVRYPRMITQPGVRDELVLNIDFAPTLLDVAGVPIPATMQGRSWRPLWENPAAANWRRSFLCEYFLESSQPTTPTVLALRTTTTKFILYPGYPEWSEMYDLSGDTYETNNLFNLLAHQSARESLQAEFDQYLGDTGLNGRLAGPVVSGTNFQWQVTGGIGPRYQVESSLDLNAWTAIQAVKMTTNSMPVSDAQAGASAKFYRARMIAD